jgi:DNA-binding transcriptional LysR family regulator
MHLKWLEDVLAIARASSLTEAANARRVTQPAFSRRLRALEAWLGTDVIDRSHKSGRLTPAAQVHLGQIEALVQDFHRLRRDIELWQQASGRLVLVAQHSLATTMVPRLVVCLRGNEAIAELRVRAADMDECQAMLANGDADILVAYQNGAVPMSADGAEDRIGLASDHLVAVAAPDVAAQIRAAPEAASKVDIVAYPKNVFFGALLHREVLPALGARRNLRIRCETALASGVMELVLAEMGVGWLPRLLAEDNLLTGRLVDLTDDLGGAPLRIAASRSRQNTNPLIADAWHALLAASGSGA